MERPRHHEIGAEQRTTTGMKTPADDRILGLSPRARRFVVPFLALAVVIVVLSYFGSRKSDEPSGTGPVVGGDLHAVGALGSRIFVGGHNGAGYRLGSGGWRQIGSLDDKDVMGWASTGHGVLAGGHTGLYASTNRGVSFEPVAGLPVSDVHALGASSSVVYLASPEAGTLVSTDGGATFKPRSSAGRDFMGTIWVDPKDPNTAIAPSMQDGAVRTTDGGATWTPIGSTPGAMAVAVDATGSRLIVVGMEDVQLSTDGGSSWSSLAVPAGTSTAAYTDSGDLVVAALVGTRAIAYRQAGTKWDRLR